jgi:hypothetical protein
LPAASGASHGTQLSRSSVPPPPAGADGTTSGRCGIDAASSSSACRTIAALPTVGNRYRRPGPSSTELAALRHELTHRPTPRWVPSTERRRVPSRERRSPCRCRSRAGRVSPPCPPAIATPSPSATTGRCRPRTAGRARHPARQRPQRCNSPGHGFACHIGAL